jgi:single-strand DNA-binding protein
MSESEKLPYEPANHVFLRGMVASAPVVRTLPSGDELCAFRLTVPRPPGDPSATRVRVDSIDCASTRATVRRSALRWVQGDVVEVTGALRRRFWRTPAGTPASRYEVDAASVRRAVSSGRRTGA